MRSGSYNKDKEFASCIPRVPTLAASAAALSVPRVTLAALPPPSYFPPHYPGEIAGAADASAATTMAIDMDGSASPAAAAAAAFDSDDEQERSSFSSSGSESDTEFATELLGPGELERGCTFDEACRMLLDTGPDDDAEEATESPDGPCALDW